MALAHVIDDQVEAAYRRGDLFAKRARLMAEWARYCTTPQRDATVTPDSCAGVTWWTSRNLSFISAVQSAGKSGDYSDLLELLRTDHPLTRQDQAALADLLEGKL